MGQSGLLGNEANKLPFSNCCFGGVERWLAKTSGPLLPSLPRRCLGTDRSWASGRGLQTNLLVLQCASSVGSVSALVEGGKNSGFLFTNALRVEICVVLDPKCSWDEGAAVQAWGCSTNLSPSLVVPALANLAVLRSACRAVGKERSHESARRKKGSGLFSEVRVALGGFSC